MPGHAAPPAVGLAGVALDLVIGAVLFVVVCVVTAVLMFILQAVLPGGGPRNEEEPGATPPDAEDPGDVEPASARAQAATTRSGPPGPAGGDGAPELPG